MKILQLVDWMSGLSLRVASMDITLEQLEDENYVYEKLRVTKNTLILELKTFEGNQPWIVGLELDSGMIVVLPWWYFREADL